MSFNYPFEYTGQQPPPSAPLVPSHPLPPADQQGLQLASQPALSKKRGARPPPADKRKKTPKPATQLDLDLKMLVNCVDENKTLKLLAAAIRQTGAAPAVPASPVGPGPLSEERFFAVLALLLRLKRLQLFGMAWLKKACRAAPDGLIPRDKIFARYVTVCADHGVSSLLPALFGKLIRVIYPCITVHRYGNRGQSKYHYCGISMVEPPSGSATPGRYRLALEVSSPLRSVFDGSLANLPIYLATELSPVSGSYLERPERSSAEFGLVFRPSLLQTLDLFTKKDVVDMVMELPPIQPYVPSGVSPDIAVTLFLLYRLLCTQIFETVRYMRVGELFRLVSSFPGLLTNQAFLLYVSESILPWVLRCDMILYETVLKMLFKLAVSGRVHGDVCVHMREIASKYTLLVSEAYATLPQRMRSSKVSLASRFARLIGKTADVCDKGATATERLLQPIPMAVRDLWSRLDVGGILDSEAVLASFAALNPDAAQNLIKAMDVDMPSLLERSVGPVDRVCTMWMSYFVLLVCHVAPGPAAAEPCVAALGAMMDRLLEQVERVEPAWFARLWAVKCWINEWVNWYGEVGRFITAFNNQGGDAVEMARRRALEAADCSASDNTLSGEYSAECVLVKHESNEGSEEGGGGIDLVGGFLGDGEHGLLDFFG